MSRPLGSLLHMNRRLLQARPRQVKTSKCRSALVTELRCCCLRDPRKHQHCQLETRQHLRAGSCTSAAMLNKIAWLPEDGIGVGMRVVAVSLTTKGHTTKPTTAEQIRTSIKDATAAVFIAAKCTATEAFKVKASRWLFADSGYCAEQYRMSRCKISGQSRTRQIVSCYISSPKVRAGSCRFI